MKNHCKFIILFLLMLPAITHTGATMTQAGKNAVLPEGTGINNWLVLPVLVLGLLLVCTAVYSAWKLNSMMFSDGDETKNKKRK